MDRFSKLDFQVRSFIACILVLVVLWVEGGTGVRADNTSIPLQPGQNGLATVSFSTNQNIATYTLFTGTTQAVIVTSCVFEVTTTTTGAGLTLSVQTDDTTPVTFLTAVAVASLTAGKNLTVFSTPTRIPTGKHIQASIAVANGTGGAVQITCIYTPEVLGGSLV